MYLKINNLTKKYGNLVALDSLNTTLSNGITGLLGANGSGKTTLIRMIVGVLDQDQGEVIFNGQNIKDNKEDFLFQLGYMPQHLGMYPNFKVDEFLMYIGAIKGLTKEYTKERINLLLPMLHLEAQRKKKIKTLSGEMKQRLGITQALLNDPKLLILDEPTAGLDPKERNEFSNILSRIAKEKIILLSTHIVSDIESCAHSVLILKDGQMIAHNKPEELTNQLIGKVKEYECSYQEYEKIQKDHVICSQKEMPNRVYIRYIINNESDKGSIVSPTLNDVYLAYFKKEEDS